MSGWVRIILEISTGVMGVWAGFIAFENFGLGLVALLYLVSYILDRHRWLGLLSLEDAPLDYVTATHR